MDQEGQTRPLDSSAITSLSWFLKAIQKGYVPIYITLQILIQTSNELAWLLSLFILHLGKF